MIEFLGVSVYLLIALVSGIMLMIIAFMGTEFSDFDSDTDVDGFGDGAGGLDHFEGGHGDFSGAALNPLSLPLVLAFFTSFGGFGAMFEALNWNAFLTPGVAAAVSILISIILYFVMDRIFIKTQATSTVKYHKLVGKDATVTVPIGKDSQGQVLIITEERGRTLMSAVSSEDIPNGSTVTVEGFAGSSVIVKRKVI